MEGVFYINFHENTSNVMQSIISVNGKICNNFNESISAFDRGFLYGDQVFEVLLGLKGKIININKHLNRIQQSAAQIEMELPWSSEELRFEIESLLQMVPLQTSLIRLVITRGNATGVFPPQQYTCNKIIYILPAPTQNPALYQTGLHLLAKNQKFTMRGAHPKTSSSYLPSIIALQQAKKQNFDDILWINSEHEITEASSSNIFFIGRIGDSVEISTPSLQSGILAGITRETIIQLLKNAKIPVIEQIIYKDELARFDEAFLTSSVRGLVPISKIDSQILHSTRGSSVFRKIESLYKTWLSTQI